MYSPLLGSALKTPPSTIYQKFVLLLADIDWDEAQSNLSPTGSAAL